MVKAREYIEHKFLPWILFLEKKNTIKHFVDGKESYLSELYNHISKEFNSLEHYELYMFRVQFISEILPKLGLSNILIIKTPEAKYQNEAQYIIIIYNDDALLYYTVDYLIDITYQIKKTINKNTSIVTNTTLDIKEIMQQIKNDLMMN